MNRIMMDELDEMAAMDYIHNGYLAAPQTFFKASHRKFIPIEPAAFPGKEKLVLETEQRLKNVLGDLRGACRAVMFSGGFDSVLVCLAARNAGARATAVTVAFENFNALTVRSARERARWLGIEHVVIHVTLAEYVSAFERTAELMAEPYLDLDLAVVYAALKKYDPADGGDVFISGMGSDQWFGNEGLDVKSGGIQERLHRSLIDESAHQRVAEVHGCRFVFPFLSRPMLALSQAVPADWKKDKKLLRALPMCSEIPPFTTERELQVPASVRRVLIKTFGHRAWPDAVSADNDPGSDEQRLRKIFLGIWLENNR